MRQLRTCDGRTARLCNWYYELCKTSEANCKNGLVPTLNLLKTHGGESGIRKGSFDRLFAFNKMPKTDVFTVTYLLSHLEHESYKKRSFTPISLITVWTVWMRFPRHAKNLLLYQHACPLGFRNASRRVVGFHDGG